MAGKEIAMIDEENMAEGDADNRAQVRVWLRLLACTSLIGAELRRQFREEFDFTMPRFDVLASSFASLSGWCWVSCQSD